MQSFDYLKLIDMPLMWKKLKPLNDSLTHPIDMMYKPITVSMIFTLETDDNLLLVVFIVICVIFLIKILLRNLLISY